MSHPSIFISYRHDDVAGHVGRLYDSLLEHFDRSEVFVAFDYIVPGEDFVDVLQRAVGASTVMLAVIGKYWLYRQDGIKRQLDAPTDYVRIEIVNALERDITIIPVFVNGGTMPVSKELPDELSPLTRRHGIELTDIRWKSNVEELVNVMSAVLGPKSHQRGHRRQRVNQNGRFTKSKSKMALVYQQLAGFLKQRKQLLGAARGGIRAHVRKFLMICALFFAIASITYISLRVGQPMVLTEQAQIDQYFEHNVYVANDGFKADIRNKSTTKVRAKLSISPAVYQNNQLVLDATKIIEDTWQPMEEKHFTIPYQTKRGLSSAAYEVFVWFGLAP